MASQAKQPEFILGEVLTFSGVVDAVIAVIDHYSRWEVLVSLQEHIPFLAHPITPLILLVTGTILIQRSMRKTLLDSLNEPKATRLHNEHGEEIVVPIKAPSMIVTYIVIVSGLVVACMTAAIWILTYNPKTPTIVAKKITAPPICKTVDCFPRPPRSKPRVKTPSVNVNSPTCPNGVCAGHDVNGPVTINPPTNPNAGTTTYDCIGVQKWVGQTPGSANTVNVNDKLVADGIANKMVQLNNSKNYTDLIALCSEKIKSAPEWLTPYLFCGLGYLESGDKARAGEFLSHYDQNKGPAYEGAPVCKQIADYLHAHL